MTIAVVLSRGQVGLKAPLVHVEVLITGGLPQFSMVGLPETAVKEARDRVRGAILTSGFEFPRKRITVNLAPADLPKDGGRFDLSIALGILCASHQLEESTLSDLEFLGELALTGDLRPIQGALNAAISMRTSGRSLIVANNNAQAAALAPEVTVYGANSLRAVWNHLNGIAPLEITPVTGLIDELPSFEKDFSDVHGQHAAKRALEIAAAGRHNLLLVGPPGTGKTMLATRLPTILPYLSHQEALETAAIYSISHSPRTLGHWHHPPFRAPHHSASSVALVGGTGRPKPGEISLAHNGILFLDELSEFGRPALEGLREPIEAGRIIVSRAAHQAEFPAKFQLLATMNPCPCGYLNDGTSRCHCSEEAIRRYQLRISGPLLDRIDILLAVSRSNSRFPFSNPSSNPISESIRARVISARKRQMKRAKKPNTELTPQEIIRYCTLASSDQSLLNQAINRLELSERAVQCVLRIARTIADLRQSETINNHDLSEAIGYRRCDWRIA